MRRFLFLGGVLSAAALLFGATARPVSASAADELTAATGAGQTSFVVVTDATARARRP